MASTYTMVGYGSQGESVRRLQSELNKQGYQLDEDGVFGEKTRAAVRDYQKKNSLKRDGIAGDETWGSLMSASESAAEEPQASVPKAAPTARTAKALAELEAGYKPSESVKEALAHRDSVASQRPGDYESLYEQQLAQLYEELTGRAPFSYDPEADGGFQQYTQLYTQRGRAAMEDTVGQAAALTGGYGSSYAQGAGQQAYSRYMQELMALLPEFEDRARSAYQQEGNDLRARYDLLDQREQNAYGRWQDDVSLWEKRLALAQEEYDNASAEDRKLYETMLGHYRSKAQQEQKLSASGAEVSDGLPYGGASGPSGASGSSGSGSGSSGESLSSVAAASLHRTAASYLRQGKLAEAKALLASYKDRMTPMQKRQFTLMLQGYDETASL